MTSSIGTEHRQEGVLPLEGIKILDCAALIAAPMAATLLGEFGAEVTKIEAPGGESTRLWGADGVDPSPLWRSISRNKTTITLDLHDAGDRCKLMKLAEGVDVLVTNFRVPTLQKWKLDYCDMQKINPRLIMLHITGFGRTGPYCNKPGFARVAEAYSGLAALTGEPDKPPTMIGYPLVDSICGLYGAFSILLALRARDKIGRGCLLDLALYEPTLRLIEDVIPEYSVTGKSRNRMGSDQQHSAPNGVYECKDGKSIVLPISTENMWNRLLRVLDIPSLEKFDTLQLRKQNNEVIKLQIAEFIKHRPAHDLMELFTKHGIGCGQINFAEDLVNDPHAQARGNFIDFAVEEGNIRLIAPIPHSDLLGWRVMHPGLRMTGRDDSIETEQ